MPHHRWIRPRAAWLALTLTALLIAAGCKDEPADGDGDGSYEDEDCDDTDADVYPGATEVCDGKDNDCDDQVDEDATDAGTWYADADGDGYGDATVAAVACDAPAGHVDDGTDCDDGEADVNPGEAELECDGVDNDCDPATADAPDGDGDGYSLCDDCDDADAGANPGVAHDGCDGVDSDCNGAVDDGDADGDGYTACDDCDDADTAVNPGVAYDGCDGVDNDCNGVGDDGDADGDGATACMDCDDAEPAAYPGADELCDGVDNDCDNDCDEDDAFTDNHFENNAGYGMAVGADAADQLDASCTFAGNDIDAVWVLSDTVEHDASWQALDVPYRAEGDIRVRGAAAPTAEIEDGTTVEFDPGAGLEIGDGGDGLLIADGSALGIAFTSSSATPAAGAWDGIRLGADNLDSEFTGVTVEYGGGNGWANLYWISSGGSMTDCAVENSSAWGIYRLNATPVLTNVTYAGNASGDLY